MATASIEDLLSELPVDQIAGRLGVEPAEVQRAASGALPAIFGGLKANADDPAGARSLAGALTEHSPALVEGGIDVDQVDTNDGQKIVDNVFGQNKDQVVARLSDTAGADSSLLQKLLPVLAPIALSFLSKQLMGGGATTGASGGTADGGGLGDLLGGMLGGGSSGTSGSGGLGDLLGGMLGGGRGGGSAGGLDVGSVLGDLLGGGKR